VGCGLSQIHGPVVGERPQMALQAGAWSTASKKTKMNWRLRFMVPWDPTHAQRAMDFASLSGVDTCPDNRIDCASRPPLPGQREES